MTLSHIFLYEELGERKEGTPPIKTCKDITLIPSAAPTAETYIIEIHVYDENKNPLKNVTVSLNSYTGATDKYGGVIFEDVKRGTYTLTAELKGYEKHQESITIDKSQSIDITLTKLKKIPPAKPSYIPIVVGVAMAAGLLGLYLSSRKKVEI